MLGSPFPVISFEIMSSPVPPFARESWQLRWLLVWGCGMLIGLLASDAVIGMYDAGILSLKPSLFTWGTFCVCVAVALLNRPSLCLASVGILLLPVARVFDVAILNRFETGYQQEMVMVCLRVLLVLVAMLAVLSADRGKQAMLVAAVVTVLMTSGSVVGEALGLAKFTSIPGRFSGFNGHPNSPPIMLCEMLGVIWALSRNFKLNMVMLGISVPGVALTYGRSGMLVLALMGGIYILLNARQHLLFIVLAAAVALPAIGVGYSILQSRTGQGVTQDKNTADRLQAIYDLDFDKLKSPERLKDLSDAWEGVMQKPVLGHGVGSASTLWAPHNEYVYIWLELGLPGLFLYLGMLLLMTWRCIVTRSPAGYCLIALWAYTPFAQGRIQDPHFWLTVAVAVHVLWPKRYYFTLRKPVASASPTGVQYTPKLPM